MTNEGIPTLRGLVAARLCHLGLHVQDLRLMQAFYTQVLGLSVSDKGMSQRRGQEMAFMTGDPTVHHQLALISGDDECPARQRLEHLAFGVETLADLRHVRDRAVEAGANIRAVNHGNAWSIYFADPEGNPLEVMATTPFAMQQPFGQPLDLDQDDTNILSATVEISDAR